MAAAALAPSNGTRGPDRTIRLAAGGEPTSSGSRARSPAPSSRGELARSPTRRLSPPPSPPQPRGSGGAGRGAAAGAMAAAGPFALVTSCAAGFPAEELVKRESSLSLRRAAGPRRAQPRGPGLPAAARPRPGSSAPPGWALREPFPPLTHRPLSGRLRAATRPPACPRPVAFNHLPLRRASGASVVL